jgi:hypothetical protein
MLLLWVLPRRSQAKSGETFQVIKINLILSFVRLVMLEHCSRLWGYSGSLEQRPTLSTI